MPARTDRGHQDPPRIEVVVLLVVGQGPDDPDLQPRLGQPLGHALPPLHDGDGVIERGVEVEVVELVDAAEAVGVDVHQLGPLAQRGMDAGDHERRRGHGTAYTAGPLRAPG